MKKAILIIIALLLGIVINDTFLLKDTLYNFYYYKIINRNTSYKIIENEDLLKSNAYIKKDVSSYVSTTDSLVARDKQELLNIYYSALNKGYDKLTFYCDDVYYNCGEDIAALNKEEGNFSYTNQLVNAYNSYEYISSSYSSNLRVDITINKRYSEDDIERINKEIDRIIVDYNINDYENLTDKIKIFHDYLAENNTYDEVMAETGSSNYRSDSAIGALFEGKAICSGYTDALSIFLDKLGLENARVATNEHVWNAVKIDNKWYHIDLTWDDPIVSDGSHIILHDYFMISTDKILSEDEQDHNFDRNVYDFIY